MLPIRLLERAREIEDWVEDRFIDSNGIFYTYLDTKTGGPLTDASFAVGQTPMHLPGTEDYTPAEWHNYENCGMTTAAYTQALLYRHAVERDSTALKRARRCFEAMKYNYELGKQLEEGFLPKLYGNRFSEQTSTDQVLYVMLALDHFHKFATENEKREIDRMIVNLIGFWVKRGYRYKYFWHQDMLWPLGRFPSLLLMGCKHGGDAIFKTEYDRLLAMGVNEGPIELRLEPKLAGDYTPSPYELKHQAWLIGELEGSVSMDMMELDYLLRNDPHNRWAPNWKASMKKVWDEGKLALAPDGTMYVHVLVDMKTHKPRRPEPEFFRKSEGPQDWIGFCYASGGRSADSTFHARSAVQAEKHLHDPQMRDAARHIIQSIDRKGLRSYYDPERYPPELKHRTELYSGDATANWLWAYWQGRHDGVFGEDE
ncbi:MAG: hypothetical protein IT447_07460 [Phycisphaerales bacterium]|jgi:hypothetical protein|nr:hypothetical protein [Phycisphaerales bacterium]